MVEEQIHCNETNNYLIIHELECESRLANTSTTDHNHFVNYTCLARLCTAHLLLTCNLHISQTSHSQNLLNYNNYPTGKLESIQVLKFK